MLTGNSGTFTGLTRVNAGTLAVNGTLGGTVDVVAGARLQGAGTVGTTILASDATIAPGSSFGALNITGDITSAARSVSEVGAEVTSSARDLGPDARKTAGLGKGVAVRLRKGGTRTN